MTHIDPGIRNANEWKRDNFKATSTGLTQNISRFPDAHTVRVVYIFCDPNFTLSEVTVHQAFVYMCRIHVVTITNQAVSYIETHFLHTFPVSFNLRFALFLTILNYAASNKNTVL